jgi:phosphohistidine phosphatase
LCPPLSESAAGNLDCVSEHNRTLVLLRHAKSAYPDGVADHDRPLAPRGQREAGLAGDWLRADLPAIDAVLCSTATRARETLAHTAIDAPVRYVDRLYDAVPGTVIDEITHVGDDVAVLLVVAHEPTMTQVALGLASTESSNTAATERISTKFPTSAMAVLRLACSWTDLELGSADLVDFHVPR